MLRVQCCVIPTASLATTVVYPLTAGPLVASTPPRGATPGTYEARENLTSEGVYLLHVTFNTLLLAGGNQTITITPASLSPATTLAHITTPMLTAGDSVIVHVTPRDAYGHMVTKSRAAEFLLRLSNNTTAIFSVNGAVGNSNHLYEAEV